VTVADGTKPEIAAPVDGFAPLIITAGANGNTALPDYTSQAITSDNVRCHQCHAGRREPAASASLERRPAYSLLATPLGIRAISALRCLSLSSMPRS
jgi:hypothetical protein